MTMIFSPKNGETMMVEALAQIAPQYFKPSTPELASALADRICAAIHRTCLFQDPRGWRKELSSIPPDQLRMVVEAVCQKENSLDALENLSRFVPLDKLQEAVKLRYPNWTDAMRSAQSMVKEAQQYLDAEKRITPSLKIRISNVIDVILSTIEGLINSFGVAELFKSKKDDVDNDYRGQKIMLLLSLFTMLSTMLIPVLGAPYVAGAVGGAFLVISALSIVYPHIRPARHHLHEGENWTQLFLNGKFDEVDGRKNYLDEIARILIASKRMKIHPMLIGKSGVGKTEAIKAFVQAIERGDYPELQGKQVIHFNVANLEKHQSHCGASKGLLAHISDQMGRHRDEYILVFDEIHYALKEKEGSTIGDQFKKMLDPGNHLFPYVIGVTTEEEYYRDIYVNHSGFARRFKPIRIENSAPHETLEILSKIVLRQAPQVLLEPDALAYIVKQTSSKFPEAPQPLAAQKVLTKCIRSTADSQVSRLESQADSIRSQIESLYAQAAVVGADQNAPWLSAVQPLEEQLRNVEMNLIWERQQIDRFFEFRDQLHQVKKASMKKVMQAVQYKKKHELTAFLLLNYFKRPLMEANLRSDAKRLGLYAVIDRPLIDRTITEEQENEQKIKKARAQGLQDLFMRTSPNGA